MAPSTVDVLAAALLALPAGQASALTQAKRHPSNDGGKPDRADAGTGGPLWSCLGRSGYTISPRNMPIAMSRDGGKWSIDQFHLDKQLYEGRASCLFLATDKQSGTPVALKCYHKNKLSGMNRRQVEREVDIHLNLKHKHIIKLYASFEDRKSVYLVLEPAACDLFHSLKKDGPGTFTEQRCRDSIAQVLSACMYLHDKGVVHRDIKPENILLSPSAELKLADFGLAINAQAERPITRLGTLDYMAPEVIRCPQKREAGQSKSRPDLIYSSGVDVWALGVLVYELLTGSTPFSKKSRSETCEQILAAGIVFPDHVSGQAASFIRAALHKDGRSRPTVQQLMMHPWLTEGNTADADAPEPAPPPATPARAPAAAAAAPGIKPEPPAGSSSPRSFSSSPFMHHALQRSAFSKGRAWEEEGAADPQVSTPEKHAAAASPASPRAGMPEADAPAADRSVRSAAGLAGPAPALGGSQLLNGNGGGSEAAVAACTKGGAGEAEAAATAARTAQEEGAKPPTHSAAQTSSCGPSHASQESACEQPEPAQPSCSIEEGALGPGGGSVRIRSMVFESSSGSSASLFGRHRSLWAAARGNTAVKEQGLRSHSTLDPSDGSDRQEEREDSKQEPRGQPGPAQEAGASSGFSGVLLRSWGNEHSSGEIAFSSSSSGGVATRPPRDGVLSEGPAALSLPQAPCKSAAAGAGAGASAAPRPRPQLNALLINLKSCPAPHVTSPKIPLPSRELYPEGLLGMQPSFHCPIRISPANSSEGLLGKQPGFQCCPLRLSPANSLGSCGGAGGLASPTAEPRPHLQALLPAPRPRQGLPMLSLSCSSVQAWAASDPAMHEAARAPASHLTTETTSPHPESGPLDAPWHSAPLPVLRSQLDRSLLQPSSWSRTPAIRSPAQCHMQARNSPTAASNPVPSEHHASHPSDPAAECLYDGKATAVGPVAVKQQRRWSQQVTVTGAQMADVRGLCSTLLHNLTRRSRARAHSSSSGTNFKSNGGE